MNNVLIVAAHPDDEILGCGVAIQHHKSLNDKVYVLYMTHDAVGRYDDYSSLSHDIDKAHHILKTDKAHWVTFPDQGLDTIKLTRIITPIEEYIAEYNINIVYTHHYGDINKDHRLTYEATITACRPTPDCTVKRLLSYWVPSSSEWMRYDSNSEFQPNYVMNAKGYLKNKIEAMRAYRSELRKWPHPRSERGIQVYAEMFGMQFGMELAEPFQILYDRHI